jgi:hypothetical protein
MSKEGLSAVTKRREKMIGNTESNLSEVNFLSKVDSLSETQRKELFEKWLPRIGKTVNAGRIKEGDVSNTRSKENQRQLEKRRGAEEKTRGKERSESLVFLIDRFVREGTLEKNKVGEIESAISAEFDDLFNGTDLLLQMVGSLDAGAVGVDATSQVSYEKLHEKMIGKQSGESLFGSHCLTNIEYWKTSNFEGRRKNVPHYVVGRGGDYVDKMTYSYLQSKGKIEGFDKDEWEKIKGGFNRALFLQIYIQAEAISILAKKERKGSEKDEEKRATLKSVEAETRRFADFFYVSIEDRAQKDGFNLSDYISGARFVNDPRKEGVDTVFDETTFGVTYVCLDNLFSKMGEGEIRELGKDENGDYINNLRVRINDYLDYLKKGSESNKKLGYNVDELGKKIEKAFAENKRG